MRLDHLQKWMVHFTCFYLGGWYILLAANVGVHTRLHDESDHTRRRRHNERHGRNRLGEAHPRTWRMLVTKVAARIIVSTRRVRVLLSASWPNVPYLRRATVAVESFVPH